MPIAVGIDLGTYRSALAIYMNEEITVIPPENNREFLRSVVSFTSDGILVGDLAEEQATVNPENTIFEVKRIIGRRFDNPRLQEFLLTVLYKVENVHGKPKISVNYKGEKRLYDPESIYAIILKRLKMKAEIILGHKIASAVITVPAFFNDSQRQATKDAGSLAGLNVLQILNEPTAAAIAYGLDKNLKEEKYVLIYDFGSGMFDVSILKVKHGSSFETQATAGDINLGGIEINSALVDYCVDLFYKEHKKDIKSDLLAVRRLRIACSHAKIVLSKKDETDIKVESLIDGIDFHANISRSKLEELCEDIFNRSIELLHNVVVDSGIDKKDINDIVLVGGISKIPKIRQLVSNYFGGKNVALSFTPSLAVVYGAAIQGAFLSGYIDRRIQNMLCVDVVLLPIGIETLGGIMKIVIPRGSPIPTKASYTITTHTDNQPGVSIRIYEGQRALTCNNHFLGTLELNGLPLLPQGVPKVDLTFEIDSSGILTVSAEETRQVRPERDGKKFNEITINLEKGRLTEDEIKRIIKEADESEQEDKIAKERIQRRNALESYVNTIKSAALKDTKNKLSDRDRLEITKICHGVLDWLEENLSADVQAITEKRKEAIQHLQPYAHLLGLSVVKRHSCVPACASGTCNLARKSVP